ncbi:uncharacterized protein DSM5745_08480 [Aspergillus mulundensis]|uniref:Uncharacterized protein n=1 Tax=Aspergillus mulundensis TaxID=1810919 RepID=A0A3D8R425_9EURO|nr:hypothetical protein DSM5745_08480 [Aspergillus mulundensis]RDW68720.1 hypothetical protein DSM5745_08480 [Aspergillus mulundensis]
MSSRDSHVSRSSRHSSSSGRSRHGDADSTVSSSTIRHSAAPGGSRLYESEGSVIGSEVSRSSRRSSTAGHSTSDRDSHVSSSRHSSSGRSRHGDAESTVSSSRHSVSGRSSHGDAGSTVSSSRHSSSGRSRHGDADSTVSSSRHSSVSGSSRHSRSSESTVSSYRHSAAPGGSRLYESEGSVIGSDVSRSSRRSSTAGHGHGHSSRDGGLAARLRDMTIHEEPRSGDSTVSSSRHSTVSGMSRHSTRSGASDYSRASDRTVTSARQRTYREDFTFLIGRTRQYRKENPFHYYVILHGNNTKTCEHWFVDIEKPTRLKTVNGHTVGLDHFHMHEDSPRCTDHCKDLTKVYVGTIKARDRPRWDKMWELYDPTKYQYDLLAPYAWSTMVCEELLEEYAVVNALMELGGDFMHPTSGQPCYVEHVPYV